MAGNIAWHTHSPIDGLMARASSGLDALASGKSRPRPRMALAALLESRKSRSADIAVELTRAEAFHDVFSAPVKSRSDLRKLLNNEVTRVSPLGADVATMLPAAEISGGRISVLHVRTAVIEKLEAQARKLGLRSVQLCSEEFPEEAFELPLFVRQSRLSRNIASLAAVLIVVGAWLGLSTIADRREAVAEQWEYQELALRSQVIARDEVGAEARAFEQFARLQPEHVSPQGVIQRIANLTDATPDAASWTELRLTADAIYISAVSDEAGATLQALAATYGDPNVRFSGSVADLRDGKQSFSIEISEPTDG